MASGFPLPVRYSGFDIIEYHAPLVTWQQVQAQAAKEAAAKGQTTSINAPTSTDTIYRDFSITEPLKNIMSKAGEIVGGGAAGVLKPLTQFLILGGVFVVAYLLMRKK